MDEIKRDEITKMPEMAFIIGMGRSGTTLLTNMFNSNPAMISTPENEFIVFGFQSFKHKSFANETVVDAFIQLFEKNYNKVISIWKPDVSLKQGLQRMNVTTFADACKLAYLHYPFANKQIGNVHCIVDKNPSYSLYLDKLHVLYPDARFIVLVRDYRDNVLSRKKYADASISIFELAASWNYYYKRIFKSIEKFNLNCKILKYEELVENSEASLMSLCEFLHVSYSPEMLNYQDLSKKIKEHVKENKGEGVYNKINQMHFNLDNKVNTSRVNAYENELSAEEIKILDYACATYGKRFGYITAETLASGNVKWNWRLKLLYYRVRVWIYYKSKDVYYRLPVSWRLKWLD